MLNRQYGPVLAASSQRYCRYGQLINLDAIALYASGVGKQSGMLGDGEEDESDRAA